MADLLNPFPPAAPPRPTVRNEWEWKRLSPEDQARAIHEFEKFWLGRSTPAVAATTSSGAPLVIPVLPASMGDESPSTANWKGPAPTDEERRSMDDWNKY